MKPWETTQLDPEELLGVLNEEVASKTLEAVTRGTSSLVRDPQERARTHDEEKETNTSQEEVAKISTMLESVAEEQNEDHLSKLDRLPVSVDSLEAVKKSETLIKENTQQKQTGKLRLWDFGGQTEFYATHHMFLDPDSFNIVVLDISKDMKSDLRKKTEEEKENDDDEEDIKEKEAQGGENFTVGISQHPGRFFGLLDTEHPGQGYGTTGQTQDCSRPHTQGPDTIRRQEEV